MGLIFTQTGNSTACGYAKYCSTGNLNTGSSNGQATIGGTPGGASIGFPIDSTNNICISFELIVPLGASWLAGTWAVRVNITAPGGVSAVWNGFDICRISSGCVSQATIASVSGLGISINSNGVKTATVAGIAQTPNPGDKIRILMRFSSGSLQYRPDQNIDSPFVDATTMTFLGNF